MYFDAPGCSVSLAVLWQQWRPPWASQCLCPLRRIASLLPCLCRFHAQALLRQELAPPAGSRDTLAMVHCRRRTFGQPCARTDLWYAAKTSCSTPVGPAVLEVHPRKGARQQYLVVQRHEWKLATHSTLVKRHVAELGSDFNAGSP